MPMHMHMPLPISMRRRSRGFLPPKHAMFSSLAAACGRGAAALLATPFQVRWKGGPGGIHKATRMTVIDNSGAKKIKVIDYFGRSPATLGSAVRASVKEAKPDGRVSRKEIVAAVVVRQRAVHTRKDGTTVRFQENAAQHRESAPLAAPPPPPQGAPGGSGRRALARGRAGPPGAPPLPRVRELAASIAAHFPAFNPSGSSPHEARPLRPSGDAGLRAGRPRAAGGQVPQGCVDGLASHLESY